MFSNIGLALDVHFCGDNIVASELVFLQEIKDFCTHKDINHQNNSKENCTSEKSCCSKSNDHSDCCKDEYITHESSEVVIVNSISVSLDNFLIAENICSLEFTAFSKNIKPQVFRHENYNPQKIPLYKRYCQLIFYA